MADAGNVREIALETLLLILKDGEYSHIALTKVLEKYQYLSKRDRAFLTRLVKGTLERMIELDAIIEEFSTVKIKKMKPAIRIILRMGVYQLKYMDAVPDRAACDEAVKLARKKGFRNLTGFVNAVLRNIAGNPERMEITRKDPVTQLSVRYSMPEWILRQWISEYGEERAAQMAAASVTAHPTCIRCNPALTTPQALKQSLQAQGVTVKRAGESETDGAFWISGYDYLAGLESFAKGWFSVQDISSMRVAQWADPRPGDTVLDVCASPGGKALHIAEKLRGTGVVVARDISESKVEKLRENISRSRLSNIRAECADARVPDEAWREKADIVIADLPCSGLGVLGRKTDLKYRMTERMQRDLIDLQRQILCTVRAYVRPGGTLIYSTCTTHRRENAENVHWFLDQYPEFSCEKESQTLPDTRSDGFYLARLKKSAALK